MYNPKTGGIKTTRDIYWLNRMPNEVKNKKTDKNESDDKYNTKPKEGEIIEIQEIEQNPEETNEPETELQGV